MKNQVKQFMFLTSAKALEGIQAAKQSDIRTYIKLASIFGFLVLSILPDLGHATSSDNAITETLCTVIDQLSGPVGRGIAVIAVVFLGFSLFLGKISWGLAIALALGIAAIFGANDIVSLLSSDSSDSEDMCD